MGIKTSKTIISTLCFIALLSAFALRNSAAALICTAVCLAAALVVFWRHIPALSNVSEDSPKAGTVRFVTLFNVAFILAVAAVIVIYESGYFDAYIKTLPPERLDFCSKLFMALVLSVPMAVFGNISPKMPFNRYTGLRLPWTVRDEQTWLIAHRLLGYISLPLAILLYVPVPTDMGFDTYMKFWWIGALVIWIGVPGIVSGIFYFKKYKGK